MQTQAKAQKPIQKRNKMTMSDQMVNGDGKDRLPKNQTTGYMSIIAPKNQSTGYMVDHRRHLHYYTHHNADCIVCSTLEREMVRVGAIIFCNKCVQEQFSSENPVRDERETYLKWLHKRNEMET
jgi:hypothetical protein